MINIVKYFMYGQDPGGTGETDNSTPTDDQKSNPEPTPGTNEEHEHKPLGEKIKEALQDWSNKDQADQDFDDTRV